MRAQGATPLIVSSTVISRNSSLGPQPSRGLAGGLLLRRHDHDGVEAHRQHRFQWRGMLIGGTTTVSTTEVSRNSATVAGGGVESAGNGVTVESSLLLGNHAGFTGGGYYGGGTIADSAIVGNSAAAGGGVAVERTRDPVPTHAVRLTVDDTTVSENSTFGGGGVFVDNEQGPTMPIVELRQLTVVNNKVSQFGQGNDVAVFSPTGASQSIGMAGSIVASTAVGGPDCNLENGTIASHGFNFSADGSCGPGMGATDRISAGDPMLSPRYISGDFWSMSTSYTPAFGSPVKDAIPTSEPLCGGTDQLGNPRPAQPGSACDVGSIEAQAPVYTNDGTFRALSPARVLDTRVGVGNVPTLPSPEAHNG